MSDVERIGEVRSRKIGAKASLQPPHASVLDPHQQPGKAYADREIGKADGQSSNQDVTRFDRRKAQRNTKGEDRKNTACCARWPSERDDTEAPNDKVIERKPLKEVAQDECQQRHRNPCATEAADCGSNGGEPNIEPDFIRQAPERNVAAQNGHVNRLKHEKISDEHGHTLFCLEGGVK